MICTQVCYFPLDECYGRQTAQNDYCSTWSSEVKVEWPYFPACLLERAKLAEKLRFFIEPRKLNRYLKM